MPKTMPNQTDSLFFLFCSFLFLFFFFLFFFFFFFGGGAGKGGIRNQGDRDPVQEKTRRKLNFIHVDENLGHLNYGLHVHG